MKSKARCWCVALMTICAHMALAENPAGDPIGALLFSPEMLMQHRQEIGLTDKQVEQIHARLEAAAPKAREQQTQVNAAMGRLTTLLSAEQLDEESVLEQLDEVLAIEKELKHLHLRLMIRIRHELNPQQRQVAVKLKQIPQSTPGTEQRLQAKISRIEKEVQSRSGAGQSPLDAVGLMQKFPELMQNGQVAEAEVLLDRVIKMLGLDPSEGDSEKLNATGLPLKLATKIRQVEQGAQKMQQRGEDVSEIQELMQGIAPLMQRGKIDDAEKLIDEALHLLTEENAAPDAKTPPSPEDLRSEVEALRKEDVAWRQIAWKTCLIDGLQASRQQNKPIMLWIFIDRPIDDERC